MSVRLPTGGADGGLLGQPQSPLTPFALGQFDPMREALYARFVPAAWPRPATPSAKRLAFAPCN